MIQSLNLIQHVFILDGILPSNLASFMLIGYKYMCYCGCYLKSSLNIKVPAILSVLEY